MGKIWLLGTLWLAGCTPPAPQACTFPGTSPMLVAQLFFGRANVADPADFSHSSQRASADSGDISYPPFHDETLSRIQ